MLPWPFSAESVLPLDACDGSDAVWQIELVPESPGAEAWETLDVAEDLLLVLRRGLVGTGVWRPAPIVEPSESICLEASEPFPDGVPGALDVDGGLADAVLPGIPDHPEPEIVDMVLRADHGIVPNGTHEHLRAVVLDNDSLPVALSCVPLSFGAPELLRDQDLLQTAVRTGPEAGQLPHPAGWVTMYPCVPFRKPALHCHRLHTVL